MADEDIKPCEDVRPITGTYAKVAARLMNFKTGYADLTGCHVDFLDKDVRDVIRNMLGPWVDLYGYASRKGDESSNMTLSINRINSVKNRISQYATKVNFQIGQGVGDTESAGRRSNDDGYWRAVEVYVYAYKPPAPVPPTPAFTLRRVVSRSFSKVEPEKDVTLGDAPDPKADGTNDLLKFAMSFAQGKTLDEGLLGDEDPKKRMISHIPAGHRVNKVIVDQKLSHDWYPGGNITQTYTDIKYEWGEPRQNVTVETRYQFTWGKVANAPVIDTKSISRKDANLSGVVTPPDPGQ